MKISEIQRTQTDQPNAGEKLNPEKGIPRGVKPVPGAPDLGYLLVGGRGQMMSAFTGANYILHLFDLEQSTQIGYLSLRDTIFPLPKSKQVTNALIYPEYRGRGLGQSLYGVATKVLGLTIVADDSQTPEARRLWNYLHNVPGVTVRGWINFLAVQVDPNDQYGDTKSNLSTIARLQGLPKGQMPRPLRKPDDPYGYVYYDFPVESGPNGRELQVARNLVDIYTKYHPEENPRDYDVGLFARWTGQ